MTAFSLFHAERHSVLLLLLVSTFLVLGYHIPAVGFLFGSLDYSSQEQMSRMHIFTAGLTSWFTTWSLLQIFVLFKHYVLENSLEVVPLANPFDVKVLLFALLLTGFVWLGLMKSVVASFSQTTISTSSIVIGIITGLAGMGLLFFLARSLDYLNYGYGFWGFIALFDIYGFSQSLSSELQFLQTGALSRHVFLVSLVLLLICIVSAIIMMRERQGEATLSARQIFAALLLSTVAMYTFTPWIFAAVGPMLPWLVTKVPAIDHDQIYRLIAYLTEVTTMVLSVWLLKGRRARLRQQWDIIVPTAVILLANEVNYVLGGLGWSLFAPMVWAMLALIAREAQSAFHDLRRRQLLQSTAKLRKT